jgi:hypothetical protein
MRTNAPICERDGTATLPVEMPPLPAADPRIGRVLDARFRVDERLGGGGYGDVYRGVDLKDGRAVALKFLASRSPDAAKLARFKSEAQLTARLGHRNTVHVLHAGYEATCGHYIVMEFLRGQTLDRVMRADRVMAPHRATKILIQILSSLSEAHQLGLVHRDIKPLNIMVMDEGPHADFVKVLDFGMVRAIDGPGNDTGQQIAGSLRQIAPEQWACKPVDGRTDLYAVGCIAYEMLSGCSPFRNENGEPNEWIFYFHAHTRQVPRPLAEIAPSCGPELSALVAKLLEKSPDDRPRDAHDVIRELEGLAIDWPDASGPARLPTALPVRESNDTGRAALGGAGVKVGGTLKAAALAARWWPAWMVAMGLFALSVWWWRSGEAGAQSALNSEARPAPLDVPVSATSDAVAVRADPVVEDQGPAEPKVITPKRPDMLPIRESDPAESEPDEVVESLRTVHIVSTPRDATVSRAGRKLGRTPMVVEWPPREGRLILTVSAEGYREQVVDLADPADGHTELIRLERVAVRQPTQAKTPSGVVSKSTTATQRAPASSESRSSDFFEGLRR